MEEPLDSRGCSYFIRALLAGLDMGCFLKVFVSSRMCLLNSEQLMRLLWELLSICSVRGLLPPGSRYNCGCRRYSSCFLTGVSGHSESRRKYHLALFVSVDGHATLVVILHAVALDGIELLNG